VYVPLEELPSVELKRGVRSEDPVPLLGDCDTIPGYALVCIEILSLKHDTKLKGKSLRWKEGDVVIAVGFDERH
jgi:hypothetical protein